MNNFSYERLHSNLQYLKLNTIEELFDNYLEIAARDSKTTMEVLDYLFERNYSATDKKTFFQQNAAILRIIAALH